MKRRHLLSATTAALALAGCGGGGSGSDTRTADLSYKDKAWFEGTLRDTLGNPVAGAKVYIPYGNSEYSTTTDSSGKFNFQVAISDLSGLSQWLMKAYKDGFLPWKVVFDGPITGATTYGVASGLLIMTPLLANEYTSLNYARLVHTGDDSYSGSANSQLQVATMGKYFSSEVLTWAASMNGRFRTAEIKMSMRGLQGTGMSTKGFLALMDSNNLAIGNTYSLNFDTDSNGGYSTISFVTTLPRTITAGVIRVYEESGSNSNGYDDVEFTGISVRLIV